jgi:hypothetical protein
VTDPDVLRNHPLRGALFGNWVVAERLKHRCDRGNLPPMCYWRDSKGCEISLVLDDGPQLLGLEIKSGATCAADWPDTPLARCNSP